MALDPVERHFMRVHRDEQPFPEVRIFYRSRLRADPVMLNPAVDPFLVESVHEIFLNRNKGLPSTGTGLMLQVPRSLP